MNARDLAELAPGRGPDRIAAFLPLARRYAERAAEAEWDSVIGDWDGLGPLTVAQHTGLAVGEWHIHAWDLAQAAGADHRPSDPAIVAAGRSILLAAPVQQEADPWLAALIGAGRRPLRATAVAGQDVGGVAPSMISALCRAAGSDRVLGRGR